MIKKITRSVLEKHHFWRYASFDELIELYVSNMLRAVAANVFSVFVPIYMLGSGYEVRIIALYYVFYFVVRMFGDLLSGFVVSKIGPKHTWIFSHLCNIITLVLLLGIESSPVMFWTSAVFNGLSTSFQHLPLHVDFSKIKHQEHNGKEQGFFMILEKVGSAVGPILGGFIAATYAPSFTIIASIIIYIISLIPLLSTPEPVRTRQHITFKNFPFKKVKRDIITHCLRGIDTTVTAGMWPIFLALAVFKGSAYEAVGFASTVAIVVALFSAYLFGRLIDNRHPILVLRVSTIVNALLHGSRIFAGSLLHVVGINITNEVVYTGSVMAYNKGMYAAADDLPGYRIAYFTLMEFISEFAKISIWILLALLTFIVDDITALQVCFAIAGVLVLGVMLERFKALRPREYKRLLQ